MITEAMLMDGGYGGHLNLKVNEDGGQFVCGSTGAGYPGKGRHLEEHNVFCGTSDNGSRRRDCMVSSALLTMRSYSWHLFFSSAGICATPPRVARVARRRSILHPRITFLLPIERACGGRSAPFPPSAENYGNSRKKSSVGPFVPARASELLRSRHLHVFLAVRIGWLAAAASQQNKRRFPFPGK